jgi:hypothetical protein
MSADSRGGLTRVLPSCGIIAGPLFFAVRHYPSNHAPWVRHSSECHQSAEPRRPGLGTDCQIGHHLPGGVVRDR